MSDAKLFAITGFGGGLSIGVQADTPAEFLALLAELQANPTLANLFGPAVGSALNAGTAQAVASITQAFPQAQPVSTVGQPLPQPPVAAPVAQPSVPVAPPTTAYPGNCVHGVRQYVDKPARGKPWRRWECNVPWSKGVTGRCDPINVES